MWADLLPVGRDARTGGYRRFAWNAADLECRAWFREQAERRGLVYEADRNGNQWAWYAGPGAAAAAPRPRVSPARARPPVVTGSHLDSVPDGGAFDGPLGVISSFAAFDLLIERGAEFRRPLAIVNFGDEEGARFGVACVGSRLAAGVLTPEQARALKDGDGVCLPDAMAAAGYDPERIGADPELLDRIGCFVELHVEQGRKLVDVDAAVGVASAIWPHGRWRFDFRGEANHAGTTRLEDRRDPMLTYATTVLAARKKARLAGAVATFGKVAVEPNGTNAIASLVRGWLDSRAPEEVVLDEVVAAIAKAAADRAEIDGTEVDVVRESYTPIVEFAGGLRDRIAKNLGGAPVLPTGAGHDAGILSATLPTAMVFVRNPTGVSHSPAESAEMPDCLAGVEALADVLADLLVDDSAGRGGTGHDNDRKEATT
ncbi:allantoate amidohydrolase [Yinghuangia soli]|uniref:Allantoate amidohydrolase n=1 Tax=Yinghuangia soli TaxID=2908204 RepID=A0AA41U5C4_9ACTN|nr:allantoate amidohydrolase [Yinghuangia soli]MCF2529844.1 allantoate amidohydrolase [Yinghuangia soli]